MARRPNAKSVFETVSRLGPVHSAADLPPTKAGEKTLRLINKLVDRAFKGAKMDRKKEDWRTLATWLAVAVYVGPKGPGRKKRWTKRQLLRLLNNVQRMRKQNPALKEGQCCDLIIKTSPYNKMKGIHQQLIGSKTLRRQLQEAKALRLRLQMLEAARSLNLTNKSIQSI